MGLQQFYHSINNCIEYTNSNQIYSIKISQSNRMQKLFVYRKTPELKFEFDSGNKSRVSKKNNFTFSQSCSRTPKQTEEDKVFYRTRKNILTKDYPQNSRMKKRLGILSCTRPQTIESQQRRTSLKFKNKSKQKFYQVLKQDISWQKWKQPASVVENNKHLLSQRSKGLTRRMNDREFVDKDQKQMEQGRKFRQQKKFQRELGELNRFKRYIDQRKKVMRLIDSIQQEQQSALQRTFDGYRKETTEVCDYYKGKNLAQEMFSARMETSLW